MSTTARPTCAHCGERISLFECLWRELASGAVHASYAVDLQGIQRANRRLWHVGCLSPAPEPEFGGRGVALA
jgi:hypothetical protein